jgi:type IV secretory pathway VirJ component
MKKSLLFLPVILSYQLIFGQTPNNQSPQLDNNPVVITQGKTNIRSNIIAVLFSGDGGWFSFEQALADNLANSGITTIGIDTKKYFWRRKSPETTASDITKLFSYYGKEWNKSQYMLIGYSQGAEIVPFVQTRLPDEMKGNVISLVMLSPEATTDFEIHISNMVGMGSKQNTYDVIAEISRIEKTRQICVFGEDENTNVPGLLKSTSVEIIFVPGQHHYKGNAALIIHKIKEKKGF